MHSDTTRNRRDPLQQHSHADFHQYSTHRGIIDELCAEDSLDQNSEYDYMADDTEQPLQLIKKELQESGSFAKCQSLT
jgi:hypothetical protein